MRGLLDYGVVNFDPVDFRPQWRETVELGVPHLAQARTLLATATPLFESGSDAVASFEKPSNAVFQPLEYRSTNCCVPANPTGTSTMCNALCYYCGPGAGDGDGATSSGGGGSGTGYQRPAQLTLSDELVTRVHEEKNNGDDPELGFTNARVDYSATCRAVQGTKNTSAASTANAIRRRSFDSSGRHAMRLAMSTKPRLVALAVVFCAGWPAAVAAADPVTPGCDGGKRQRCFVGDPLCLRDAFDLAKDMLRGDDLLLVATGTIEGVHGLPDSLEVERDVRATFTIDGLHRYQTEHDIPDWVSVFEKSLARARKAYFDDSSARSREFGVEQLRLDDEHPFGPMRLAYESVRGIDGMGPAKRIAIHLSSRLFVWPATGTARGVARLGSDERELHGSAEGRIDALATRPEARKLKREEHERLLLESAGDGAARGGRFAEDRGGALEVGGRYLFALGERVDGDRDAYRFTENAHTTWRVFWGDEMEDVDRAVRALANCVGAFETLDDPVWRICLDAARYSDAQSRPAVLRQRHVGHATSCDGAQTHPLCFVGDRHCVEDAFDLAEAILRDNHERGSSDKDDDVLLAATGTIEDVQGLPNSLTVDREVRATFAIDWLHRYQTEHAVPDWKYFFDKSLARAFAAHADDALRPPTFGARRYDLDDVHPFRPTRFVDEWVRGRTGMGPRKRIAIHLGSDLFVWPATGTARGAARKERERLLHRESGGHGGRFVEDRGGALEVGGRYLFALGARVDGGRDVYRFTEAHAKWRVFWGGELDDVDRALKEIAACMGSLSALSGPPQHYEFVAWRICEEAARYRSARRGAVLRQRPIGQQRKPLPGAHRH